MLKRYILTGAPGAGKTALIRQLEREGFSTVEEAATDVIALDQLNGIEESWREISFTERIAALQQQRVAHAAHVPVPVQFHDRSVFCTYALAKFLEHPVSPALAAAAQCALDEGIFERRVFFIRLLGFITRTEARRISLADAIRFEAVHEATYRQFGFELISIEAAAVADRVAAIRSAL